MTVLDDKVKEQVKDMFKDLKESVKLVVFTQDSLISTPGHECETCRDNRLLMEEVAARQQTTTLRPIIPYSVSPPSILGDKKKPETALRIMKAISTTLDK